ncbi:MAG: hypothetical protein IJO29_01070 [Oscillospiraceae bacterium]|nr:hypothetical protein [Oscillospiraceae bacterium]
MMKRIYKFLQKHSECIKRTLRTFFQAFAAMLITSLSGIQSENADAQSAIIRGALTAAIAAGFAAVMNLNGGEEICCHSKEETE